MTNRIRAGTSAIMKTSMAPNAGSDSTRGRLRRAHFLASNSAPRQTSYSASSAAIRVAVPWGLTARMRSSRFLSCARPCLSRTKKRSLASMTSSRRKKSRQEAGTKRILQNYHKSTRPKIDSFFRRQIQTILRSRRSWLQKRNRFSRRGSSRRRSTP